MGNAGSTYVSRAGFEQYQRDRMAQEQQRGGGCAPTLGQCPQGYHRAK
jgi:hypothetical protein